LAGDPTSAAGRPCRCGPSSGLEELRFDGGPNQQLVGQGFQSESRLEELVAARDRDAARLRELQAQRALATLAARSDGIAAAAAEARGAQSDVALSAWREAQKRREAPTDALVFDVPMAGSFFMLSATVLLFIVATLAVGFTFSAVARSQMQSMQMTVFYFLPNILLSGFMFPFRGMPGWAQAIGEVLPLTHFVRIVRGIMLKGVSWHDVWGEAAAIAAFLLVVGAIAMTRYRQTID